MLLQNLSNLSAIHWQGIKKIYNILKKQWFIVLIINNHYVLFFYMVIPILVRLLIKIYGFVH